MSFTLKLYAGHNQCHIFYSTVNGLLQHCFNRVFLI